MNFLFALCFPQLLQEVLLLPENFIGAVKFVRAKQVDRLIGDAGSLIVSQQRRCVYMLVIAQAEFFGSFA